MKLNVFFTACFIIIAFVFVMYGLFNFHAAKAYSPNSPVMSGNQTEKSGGELNLNLFNPGDTAAKDAPRPQDEYGIKISELSYYLISTLSSSDTLLSQALFEDVRTKKYFILMTGDKTDDFKLVDVKRGYAKVLNLKENSYEIFTIKKIDLDITKSYNKPDDERVSVSRREINKQIHDNVNNLFRMVNFSPYIENGEIRGLRLDAFLQQEDFFNSVGFFQNDIIYGVNGEKIDNFEKAMKLWESLRFSNNFEITLIRDGKLENIKFEVGR